ncbi:hypothetical protein, partial [Dyella japonica]|uniref:hypothetical protein n=1 Tax=Dyella japonica TaxID=231455 RepID=UPI001E3B0C98
MGLAFRDHRTTSSLDSGLRRNDGGGRRTAVTTVVGWGKPQAHPNVAVHIDVPTLGFAALTPTYAVLCSSFLRRQESSSENLG